MTTLKPLYQQLKNRKLSTSTRMDNLEFWFLEAEPLVDTPDLMLLDEALDSGLVVVHETSDVQQLTIENLSPDKSVFVQAGEIIRGGRQDRTIQVDLVLPAQSGKWPLPAFCVEAHRWHRRGKEKVDSFVTAKMMASGKKVRDSIRRKKAQGEVWQSIKDSQDSLGTTLKSSVYDEASPSSYYLSLKHKVMEEAREKFKPVVEKAIGKHPRAVGFIFAVNGKLQGAECFPNPEILKRSWPKWNQVIIDEAIVGSLMNQYAQEETADQKSEQKEPKEVPPVAPEFVEQWLEQKSAMPVVENREVPPSTRLVTREATGDATMHTYWNREGKEQALHDSWLPA